MEVGEGRGRSVGRGQRLGWGKGGGIEGFLGSVGCCGVKALPGYGRALQGFNPQESNIHN